MQQLRQVGHFYQNGLYDLGITIQSNSPMEAIQHGTKLIREEKKTNHTIHQVGTKVRQP